MRVERYFDSDDSHEEIADCNKKDSYNLPSLLAQSKILHPRDVETMIGISNCDSQRRRATLISCVAALVFLMPTSGAFNAKLSQQKHRVGETRKMMTPSDDSNSDFGATLDRRKLLLGASGIVSSLPFLYVGNDDSNNLFRIPTASAAEATTAKPFPDFELPNAGAGFTMPQMALNTAGMPKEDSAKACALAYKYGFTHIDFHPGAQRDGVAEFMKQNGGKAIRDKLFLNTKIRKPPPGTSPADAAQMVRDQIDEDLKALNVDRVDMLMLRDSPDCDVMRAQWEVLEEAVASGKTRSIGVVNYCEGSLRCLLRKAKIRPAVNYYYNHVGMSATGVGYKLREYCDRKKIKVFAYGPFGEPGPNPGEFLEKSLFKSIGDASKNVYNQRNHGGSRTPEEVALRWVIDSGCAVSVRPSLNYGLGKGICKGDAECDMGLKLRASVFDWSLTSEEVNKLTYIIKSDENPTLFSSSGCPNAFVMPK